MLGVALSMVEGQLPTTKESRSKPRGRSRTNQLAWRVFHPAVSGGFPWKLEVGSWKLSQMRSSGVSPRFLLELHALARLDRGPRLQKEPQVGSIDAGRAAWPVGEYSAARCPSGQVTKMQLQGLAVARLVVAREFHAGSG